jgi:hypothetical protein
MLGDLGVNALVVDVYGRGIRPNNPETCQAVFWEYFIAQGGVPKSKFRWPSNPIRDN